MSDLNIQDLTDGERIALENLFLVMREAVTLSCDYTNYRGEKSTRTIRPKRFWVGSTDWHKSDCLLLNAYDFDKKADRDFKVSDFDISTAKLV